MKNNKGFTLVELLAVVTILGILSSIAIIGVSKLIEKSKNDADEQQKQTLIMAAKSYFQDNRSMLPREDGTSRDVTVVVLKNNKYLKEDIKNSKKESCMNDNTKVTITKSGNKYTYEASLNCE